MYDRGGVIEPEAVDVVLVGQVDQVLSEEVAHLRVVEIDHRSPLRVAVEKRLVRDRPQHVVRGAGVVEDHVQDHGQAVRVTDVHELLQCVRAAVAALDCIEIGRVVAPRIFRPDLVDR
jgi:hypothetical protein